MDWNRPGKLLRRNPDWEEDLERTVVVGPVEEARVKSYVEEALKKKDEECYCCVEEYKLRYLSEDDKRRLYKKRICSCENKSKPGTAPLVTLNNGRKIPSLGLRTWLGVDKEGAPRELDDLSVQHAVERAIEAGYRLIDTATSYNTEIQVGKAIKNKIQEGLVQREDMFIVSKLWNNCHHKDAVIPALKESLRKLDVDYLDLYLIHWPVGIHVGTYSSNGTYGYTDYLETWEGMIEARVRGLTKSIGVANFNQHQLDRIVSLTKVKPAVLEIELNLNLQQRSLVSFCRSKDIAVLGYSPLGNLVHSRRDDEVPPPRVDSPALVKIADKYHKTSAQIALRYLVDMGVIPVPNSLTSYHIWQNIDIFNFKLTNTEMDILKRYDKNYRLMSAAFWQESPYYPFKT